uniref:Uncharacterized protein n=1 Tax=Anguilla anguilla TaxID=7936 RepID=A0A0E9URX2_ANGAN
MYHTCFILIPTSWSDSSVNFNFGTKIHFMFLICE